MNKIERVRAALRSEKVDRIPVSFWFHFPDPQKHGGAMVKAHLDYFHAVDIDFLKVMNEHHYEANVDIKAASDWRQVRPAPLGAPFYQAQLDEIKQIADRIGDEALMVTTIFNPYSSGNHACGKLVTSHLKENPQAVSQGLAAIAESLAVFSEACIDAGASGIYFAAQGGEEERFTEEQFLRYIKPHDLTVLNAVKDKGEFHLLHICRERVRLPLYADYPGHAVNWAVTKNSLSLREGQKLFQRPVIGGLDDRGVIVSGPAESIQAAVHEVIAQTGTTGFMLGADCTLPTDIDLDHIRAAVQAVRI